MGLPGTITRYREIVDDWDAFLEALHRPLPTDLRWNPLAVERARFEAELDRLELSWEPRPGSPDLYRVQAMDGPGLTWAYHLGWYHPQGYTSTLPPVILDPAPGSSVLDLCAAPGGKSSQLAAIMQGHGVLVANDVSIHRLSILASNLERLGVPNALLTRYPGQNFPERFAFDAVLADVPCTAEGTFRVDGGTYTGGEDEPPPDLLQTTQSRILEKALRVVRPGGRVCYATCTYAPEQDEAVIAPFVERGEAEVLDLPGDLPGLPGLTGWQGGSFPPDLARTRRFWPHHTDSWGFYAALLRRPD